ncbi:DUF4139 domain-containing protein [Leptospira borgpetersenii]|uniref:PF13600 domain protein n=1 Tax=Leptospira borgpetersenii str. 200801926 TaxID=1193009 RepID=A0ABP2S1B0_LEPBO|nr:DUF4139 domain-containing protein [Leptospira borgpetersenii]EKP12997.1 hypothetical protein LEP1GSC128_3873 [Leptospira borgpetersenii str. 200801926]ENO64742.1 hypothetical protein LEP1GSC191_1737 [Leptospira borgpetersenii serovar Mini str. 201000851]URD69822.1 DUF4139 domain-containing protein [Leptospira borgpetersenii]UVD72995.1 DUF4139 domain-containing protein [Leptospira borgpetersenii]UVD76188.1 DUF4139 domain-containing protein [Leptospira borgpetersenii]
MRQSILPLRIEKKLFLNLVLIFLTLAASPAKSQDEPEVRDQSTDSERISAAIEKTDPSRIQSVVLYSSFAYVTRNLRTKIKAGSSEIYLGEIPDRVSERTISVRFPDSSKKIKIRGIRGRIRVERKARTKEIASLLRRQDILNDQIEFLSSEIQELLEEEKTIVKISPVIKRDPAPQEEIADPEFLSGFQKQYQEYLNQLSLLRRKKLEALDQIREERLVVDASLDHFGRLETKQKKEIYLEVETSEDTETSIEYKYLISGASWFPRYSLQLTEESRSGYLSWFALVRNDTGEDWEKVKLFFTASNPDLDIDLPIVREWRIQTQTSIEDSKQVYKEDVESYAAQDISPSSGKAAPEKLKEAEAPRKKSKRSTSKSGINIHGNISDKSAAAPMEQSRQIIQENYSNRANSLRTEDNLNQLKTDLANQQDNFNGGRYDQANYYGQEALKKFSKLSDFSRKELNSIETYTEELIRKGSLILSSQKIPGGLIPPSSLEGFDYQYVSGISETIPSDRSFNKVFLKKKSLSLTPGYFASPLAGPGAYLTVEASNSEGEPLLAGPMEVFSGNTLLGNTVLNTSKPGETIRMELGQDRDILVNRRETSFEQKEGVISSRTKIKYKISIEIKNRKKRNTILTLIDRVPYTVDDSVEIKFEFGKDPPSKNEEGILTYKMELPPGGKKIIEFEYSVSHPAENRLIRTPGSGGY